MNAVQEQLADFGPVKGKAPKPRFYQGFLRPTGKLTTVSAEVKLANDQEGKPAAYYPTVRVRDELGVEWVFTHASFDFDQVYPASLPAKFKVAYVFVVRTEWGSYYDLEVDARSAAEAERMIRDSATEYVRERNLDYMNLGNLTKLELKFRFAKEYQTGSRPRARQSSVYAWDRPQR